jgi:prolyl-tRNA editing enzyme YbaK/EbsC (Cys-tRNA(Pro) deacylase)
MKSGFKDPTAIKSQRPKDHPVDSKKSPWDFKCPQYDERSSSFVNAGTHYGVGHIQPVGHKEHPKQFVDVLPQGRVRTMRDDEKG